MVNADEVKIFIWEKYISQDVINAFTKETGHTVKQVYFENENIRDSVVISGRGDAYDLIMTGSRSMRTINTSQYFIPLSGDVVPNQRHINPQWHHACSKYAMPYAKGMIGIAYRTSVAQTPITSWQQLFYPPQEHTGRIAMIRDEVDAVAASLLANKHHPLSENVDELKQAFSLFKNQLAHLLTYRYGVSYALEHKEKSKLSMTFAYSGDEFTLQKSTGHIDWRFVVPEEGSLFWVECLAIPMNAKSKSAAYAFLNFINDPKVAMKNAEDERFSTVNDSALEFASSAYLNDNEMMPTIVESENVTTFKMMSNSSLKLRNRMMSALTKNDKGL